MLVPNLWVPVAIHCTLTCRASGHVLQTRSLHFVMSCSKEHATGCLIVQLLQLIQSLERSKGWGEEQHVTSSSSYLNSLEVKDQNVGSVEVSWNWLQLVCCAYLQSHPGYLKQRLRIGFLECTRMENIYWNDSKYEYKDERDRGSEFV